MAAVACGQLMAAERAHVAAPQPLGDADRVELVAVCARHHAHLLAVLKVLQADCTLRLAAAPFRAVKRLLLQAGHGRGGRGDRTEPAAAARFFLETGYNSFDVEPQRPCQEMQQHRLLDLAVKDLLDEVAVVTPLVEEACRLVRLSLQPDQAAAAAACAATPKLLSVAAMGSACSMAAEPHRHGGLGD